MSFLGKPPPPNPHRHMHAMWMWEARCVGVYIHVCVCMLYTYAIHGAPVLRTIRVASRPPWYPATLVTTVGGDHCVPPAFPAQANLMALVDGTKYITHGTPATTFTWGKRGVGKGEWGKGERGKGGKG